MLDTVVLPDYQKHPVDILLKTLNGDECCSVSFWLVAFSMFWGFGISCQVMFCSLEGNRGLLHISYEFLFYIFALDFCSVVFLCVGRGMFAQLLTF